jgi:hypothetical protein
MAGLSSAYITWKPAAEGTAQATRDLILALLNAAPSATTIADISHFGADKRALNRSAEPLKLGTEERLPERVLHNGWLKVIGADGEIAREAVLVVKSYSIAAGPTA